MNHKRGRPKNQRAGCLMCKPHKANGIKGGTNAQTRQEKLARVSYGEQRQDLDAVARDFGRGRCIEPGWAQGDFEY